MSRRLVVVPDAEALAAAAADRFAATVAAAVGSRGRAGVALAGGSTPLAAYRLLARRNDVPWSALHVFWSDERCVPPNHADSNYGRAKEALLDHVPIPAGQVHRLAGEDDPAGAADAYQQLLDRWGPRLDLVLLGVGPDGHVASLFPATSALTEHRKRVVANWVPRLAAHRLTLTFREINAARCVLLVVAGTDKAAAVAAAWGGGQSGTPARLVQPEEGEALWIADREAAGHLSECLSLQSTDEGFQDASS